MEKRYKEIDGVRYQVIQNTILGSNVVPVGESLPEVTVSDSGKVLTVNASGEWEAAAPGGGGDVLSVNFHYDNDHSAYIADKSFSDVLEALTNGKVAIGHDTTPGFGKQAAYLVVQYNSDYILFEMLNVLPVDNILVCNDFQYNANGTIEWSQYLFTLTPST